MEGQVSSTAAPSVIKLETSKTETGQETGGPPVTSTDLQSASTTSANEISKNEQKRLLKKQKWLEHKTLRRQKTRRKEKEMKEKVRKGLIPPKINDLSRKEKKLNLMKNSSCKIGVAVDMSFDHLMIEKDLSKCIKQVLRCYSVNRKLKNPLQFYVTSFTGLAQETVKKHSGWENWDVQFTHKAYTDLETFPKENLVYLTSESDNVLTELKPDHLYVIGGLVDHNSQRGLCHKLAEENGVAHARLPISEHIVMKTRSVLTINHVFEIMVLVSQGTSWDNALMQVIAPRKLPQLKTSADSSGKN